MMKPSLKQILQYLKIVFFFLMFIILTVNLFAQDLVAHYPFDGNADNSHSNDYHGTVSGAALTSDYLGNDNSAYHLNGSSTITFGDLPIDNGSFSLAFWMKSSISVGQHYRVLSKRPVCNVGQLFDIAYSYNSSTGKPRIGAEIRDDNNGNYASVSSDIDINGQWIHVTIVKDNDNTESRLYINGQLVSTNPWTNVGLDVNVSNEADLGIATSPCIGGGGVSRYVGDLDDLRVYSEALTQTEVEALSPFMLERSIPQDGDDNIASSSKIVLDLTRESKSSSINDTNITVSGSVSGVLQTSFEGAGTDHITINITNDLPYNETITVNISNVESADDESLPNQSFSFSTINFDNTLVAELNLDGIVFNTSNNVIPAIVNNGATSAKNRLRENDKAMSFDGSNDYIEIANTDLFNFGFSNDFSISFWARSEQAATERVILDKFGNNQKYQIQINSDGKLKFELMDDASVDEVITANRYDDGFWHHFAFVADRDNQLSIYVDGQLSDQATVINGGNINNVGNLRIGTNNNNTNYFNGELDDLKIYSRKLTLQEIQSLAPIYYYPTPNIGFDSAPIDADIVIEFGEGVDASTLVAGNFSLIGSKSGTINASVASKNPRIVTLDPDDNFEYDEEITVSFTNLLSVSGRSIDDATYTFESTSVDKGMLLHYTFDGDATNQAGDQFDGSVSGATLTADLDGNPESAYSFDGDDFITSGNLPISDQSFSVALWMKRENDQIRMEILGQRNVCSTVDFMQVSSSYNSTTGLYNASMTIARTAGGYSAQNAPFDIQPGVWTHVVFVKDSEAGELRSYKNGQLATTTQLNGTYNVENDASFGVATGNACINVDGRVRFKGDLDDIRVYNRVISDDEINLLTPFRIESSYPRNESENVSVSTKVVIDLNENVDGNSLENVISVSGDQSGQINATFSVENQDQIIISSNDDLPFDETITVSLTNLTADNGEVLPDQTITFTTTSMAGSLIAKMDLNANAENESDYDLTTELVNEPIGAKNRLREKNTAVSLDGVNDYISVQNNENLNFGESSDFTISGWFNKAQVSSEMFIADKTGNSRGYRARFMPDGTINFQVIYENTTDEVTTSNSFDDGFWHHIALVANRDQNLQIFVDGILEDENATADHGNITNTGHLRIGSKSDGSSYFNGKMDDFRIYNRALSAQEIEAIAPVYRVSSPMEGFDAARLNSNIEIEFGQSINAASAIADNFSITGSKSGNITFSISGQDSRVLTLDPTADFEVDETITVSYSALASVSGRSVSDASFSFETTSIHKGLVVFYPFDGNANNEAGSEFDGNINGASLTDGADGTTNSAYSFDGSQTMEFGNVPIDETSFTISYWINIPELTQDISYRLLSKRPACTLGSFFDLNVVNSSNVGYWASMELRDTNGNTGSVGGSIAGTNQWIHLTFVKDNETSASRLYIDGNLVETASWANANQTISVGNSANLGIGISPCVSQSTVTRFEGSVDELRLYDRMLSDAEILQLATAFPQPPTLTSPIGDINIDEDQNPTDILDLNDHFTSSNRLNFEVSEDDENLSILLEDGVLSIEQLQDYFGTINIDVLAYNGREASTSFNLIIDPINDAPQIIASNDISVIEDFTTTESVTLELHHPENESDQVIAYSISPAVSEITFANLTFDTSTGNLDVQAIDNQFGSETFTITADDGQNINNTGTAEVTIEVSAVNDAPEFELSTGDITLIKDFEEDYTIEITDLSPSNESDQIITYTIDPASVDFANVSIDQTSGTVTIASIQDGIGNQTFTVHADDGEDSNNTASASFTLEIVEDEAPVLEQSIENSTYDEGTTNLTLVSDVTQIFSDPEGETLTYSVEDDSEFATTTISENVLNMSISDENFNGTITVTLYAHDTRNTSSESFTVEISPVNDAPEFIVEFEDLSTNEDELFELTISENSAQDIDEDVLTYSVTLLEGGTLPSWLSFDQTTLLLSGTPGNDDVGQINLEVAVTDGQVSVSTPFDLSVVNINDAPTVSNTIADQELNEDDASISFLLTSHFEDIDGDNLSFSAATDNDAIELSLVGNEIEIIPLENAHGNGTVEITASDGIETATLSFAINIASVNDAPEISAITDQEMSQNEVLDNIAFNISDVETDISGLQLSVESDNESLIGTNGLALSTSGEDQILTLTPETDQSGEANITITVTDGELSSSTTFLLTVNAVTSINDELLEMSLNIYPNPTQGQFRVTTTHSFDEKFRVMIVDLNGKTHYQNDMHGLEIENGFDIDISTLNKGIYMLIMKSGIRQSTKRIVKQ